jgi:glycine/D-amino acid oxidase-like deaminating enzyme
MSQAATASVWGAAGVALPRVDGALRADVCVIGLGGTGLACIGALLDAGVSAIGIDAREVASGAAGRNGGFLLGGLAMFHHDAVLRLGRPAARALYEQTLEQIDRMAGETPDATRRTGTLRIATSLEERDDCRAQLAAMRRDALPVEPYEGPEGQGLLFPCDAAFDPVARCRALAEDALRRGARLFARSPAVGIATGTVETPAGSIAARRVVVAVDGALETLLPELAPRVRSARLQMLATAPAADVRLTRPVYARWGLDYWQQRADGCVVLGGCRDAGGDAEWTTSTEPTDVVQRALDALLRDGLRSAAPVTHRWAATVGYTQSGMPILEQVRPGVIAAGAYSGTGNVVGALCGRAAAALARGERPALAELLRA